MPRRVCELLMFLIFLELEMKESQKEMELQMLRARMEQELSDKVSGGDQ